MHKMDKEIQSTEYACEGSNWAEHEGYLVGNKEGLKKLQSAINEALDKGETSITAGEFVGVRCLDTKFFENKEANIKWYSGLLGWLVAFVFIFIFIMGIKHIFSFLG